MLDVLLLGEVCWVWLWVRAKSAERALLYVGAMFTAVFAATHVSPWFSHRFMESGNAFEWLTDRMQAATHPVGLMGLVVPAVPASTNLYNQSQWIALHVLQGLFTVLITWAIFMLFVIIEYLMQAFWDDERVMISRADQLYGNLSGLTCGFIVAWSTLWLLANLSWISVTQVVSQWTSGSMLYLLFGQVQPTMRSLLAMLSWG